MNTPNITATDGGPYVLSGSLPMRSMDKVTSEKGEPMTWRSGPAIELEDDTALCRCGHSGNKPYCDGSHRKADWDATDGFPSGSVSNERARALAGEGLTVLDDKMLCMHAGFCGTERTNVWEMIDETSDTEVRATTIRMVEKCPSGRLTNIIDGDAVEPDLPQGIGVVPGGPLWVTGEVQVSSETGGPLETRNRLTLCRCGASSLKPLCDGSHVEVGFDHALDDVG